MVETKFHENRRAPDGEVKDAQRRSLNKRPRIRDSQPDTVSVTPSLAYLQVADTNEMFTRAELPVKLHIELEDWKLWSVKDK